MDLTEQLHYYGERAAEYERIYEKLNRQEELTALKSWVGHCVRHRDVVEVACGTGYWTAVAAESAASIVAFDANDSVLRIARAKRLPSDRVRFLVGDAFEFPASLGKFNAALIGFWWSHIPVSRHAGFLRQLEKVLRPGGTVALFDNAWVPGESTPIARTDAEGNTYQARRLEDGRIFEVVKNFPDETSLRAALHRQVGDIEFSASKHYWRLQGTWLGFGRG